MQQWQVVFLVDNVHTEQIVTCAGGNQASEMVKKQYSGHKVVIMYVKPYHQ